MNTRKRTRSPFRSLVTALAMGLLTSTYAAVITDPILASGPGNVIDPPGGESVDQNFGTPQATLEAREDLRVLQNFTGFEASATGNNIVNFSSALYPDIQFQFSGSFSTSQAGAEATGPRFATSEGSALTQRNSEAESTSTLTISFGTWDGNDFTSNRTSEAVGFTLTQVYPNKSGSVTFRDMDGNQLSTFSYVGEGNVDGTGNHKDFYFGWDSLAESSSAIGSIAITFVDAGNPFNSGFDDLAFTVIPEPSSVVLLGLALAALGLTLRRRR